MERHICKKFGHCYEKGWGEYKILHVERKGHNHPGNKKCLKPSQVWLKLFSRQTMEPLNRMNALSPTEWEALLSTMCIEPPLVLQKFLTDAKRDITDRCSSRPPTMTPSTASSAACSRPKRKPTPMLEMLSRNESTALTILLSWARFL